MVLHQMQIHPSVHLHSSQTESLVVPQTQHKRMQLYAVPLWIAFTPHHFFSRKILTLLSEPHLNVTSSVKFSCTTSPKFVTISFMLLPYLKNTTILALKHSYCDYV